MTVKLLVARHHNYTNHNNKPDENDLQLITKMFRKQNFRHHVHGSILRLCGGPTGVYRFEESLMPARHLVTHGIIR